MKKKSRELWKLSSCFIMITFLSCLLTAESQREHSKQRRDLLSSAMLKGMQFRCIGPATASGRISDFAVNPEDRSQYYVAVSSGGVWKTINSGTTWIPIFDSEGSYSIGCIAMDHHNHHVIWVGSGERNCRNSVAYGDGVYRSDDGGKSWRNMGLKMSEHIGKIIIDPRNSDVVYVAAQGPLWGPGGDRGLYKTTDSGRTWEAILTVSENTGVNDVIFDPRDPDVLFATSYQRRSHVFYTLNGGPESAIYKSTDAGSTWNKLTVGLPTVDMGRVGLAISPVDPDIVFAIIEAADRKGGVFRTTDSGASWEKRSDYGSRGMYYGTIYADPQDVNRVYAMGVWLMVSEDGGINFLRLGERHKHIDNHAMWIDPKNTNYYLVGTDCGVYESFDRGATWDFKSNLPTVQFYRVEVDNAFPFYNVYGGTQDNFSWCGPSRTTNLAGIVNSDWTITQDGDGFETQIDTENPNIVYAQMQYGGLYRFDKQSGETMGIKPQEGKGEDPYRWNWDSPLLVSPHPPMKLYFAANKLFRSDDRGNTWKVISGDLTRQIDRRELPVSREVWGTYALQDRNGPFHLGTISALSESPVTEGLLYVGTDDGLISVTEDGGAVWRKYDRFPNVPEMTYIRYLLASQHNTNTVYAAFDNHKNSDFKPYLLKSIDKGKTWESFRGNLPERGTVYSIAEDHVNPNLIFVGTEFGLFFTIDAGNKWIQLEGGLPTIAVRDIAIQKRENDLVLATFGRGFYILDDYSPLRELNVAALNQECHLFPIKDALMYVESRPLCWKGKGVQGESYYTAENPPFGATFTYYLSESVVAAKQKRKEAEKKALQKRKQISYPGVGELREANDEVPYLLFTIFDESGNPLRKLKAPADIGIHRISWDLRYPASTPTRISPEEDLPWSDGDIGTLVLPGGYKVTLAKSVDGILTVLAGPESFNVVALGMTSLPAEDREAMVEFQKQVGELRRAVRGSIEIAKELENKIKFIKEALLDTPGIGDDFIIEIKALEIRTNEILRKLRGSGGRNTYPSVADRVEKIVSDQWRSTSSPTQTQITAYEIAGEEFGPVLANLEHMLEVDFKKLEDFMDEAGAPWTSGRIPKWKKK